MVHSSAVNGVSAWLTRRLAPAGTQGFKTVIQTETRAAHESGAQALNPPDLSGWALRYVGDSLKKLGAMAGTKGARAAIVAERSEVSAPE